MYHKKGVSNIDSVSNPNVRSGLIDDDEEIERLRSMDDLPANSVNPNGMVNGENVHKKKNKKKWVQLPLVDVRIKHSNQHDMKPQHSSSRSSSNNNFFNAWKGKKGSDLFAKKPCIGFGNTASGGTDLVQANVNGHLDNYGSSMSKESEDEENELLKKVLEESVKTAQEEEERKKQMVLKIVKVSLSEKEPASDSSSDSVEGDCNHQNVINEQSNQGIPVVIDEKKDIQQDKKPLDNISIDSIGRIKFNSFPVRTNAVSIKSRVISRSVTDTNANIKTSDAYETHFGTKDTVITPKSDKKITILSSKNNTIGQLPAFNGHVNTDKSSNFIVKTRTMSSNKTDFKAEEIMQRNNDLSTDAIKSVNVTIENSQTIPPSNSDVLSVNSCNTVITEQSGNRNPVVIKIENAAQSSAVVPTRKIESGEHVKEQFLNYSNGIHQPTTKCLDANVVETNVGNLGNNSSVDSVGALENRKEIIRDGCSLTSASSTNEQTSSVSSSQSNRSNSNNYIDSVWDTVATSATVPSMNINNSSFPTYDYNNVNLSGQKQSQINSEHAGIRDAINNILQEQQKEIVDHILNIMIADKVPPFVSNSVVHAPPGFMTMATSPRNPSPNIVHPFYQPDVRMYPSVSHTQEDIINAQQQYQQSPQMVNHRSEEEVMKNFVKQVIVQYPEIKKLLSNDTLTSDAAKENQMLSPSSSPGSSVIIPPQVSVKYKPPQMLTIPPVPVSPTLQSQLTDSIPVHSFQGSQIPLAPIIPGSQSSQIPSSPGLLGSQFSQIPSPQRTHFPQFPRTPGHIPSSQYPSVLPPFIPMEGVQIPGVMPQTLQFANQLQSYVSMDGSDSAKSSQNPSVSQSQQIPFVQFPQCLPTNQMVPQSSQIPSDNQPQTAAVSDQPKEASPIQTSPVYPSSMLQMLQYQYMLSQQQGINPDLSVLQNQLFQQPYQMYQSQPHIVPAPENWGWAGINEQNNTSGGNICKSDDVTSNISTKQQNEFENNVNPQSQNYSDNNVCTRNGKIEKEQLVSEIPVNSAEQISFLQYDEVENEPDEQNVMNIINNTNFSQHNNNLNKIAPENRSTKDAPPQMYNHISCIPGQTVLHPPIAGIRPTLNNFPPISQSVPQNQQHPLFINTDNMRHLFNDQGNYMPSISRGRGRLNL